MVRDRPCFLKEVEIAFFTREPESRIQKTPPAADFHGGAWFEHDRRPFRRGGRSSHP